MTRSDDTLLALRRIIRAAELHARKLARESGLTPVQLRVLDIARTRAASPKQIAEMTGLTQATMTAVLDRLEARGLVERHRSTEDRRRLEVVVTTAGLAAVSRAPDALDDLFTSRFANLPSWEQAMVVAALERVVDMLDASGIASTPIIDAGDIDRTPVSSD